MMDDSTYIISIDTLKMSKETFTQISDDFKFAKNEEEVIKFWQQMNLYKLILEKNKNGCVFEGMDGPAFTSGDSLHAGHIHIGSMKSVIVNFMNMALHTSTFCYLMQANMAIY